MPRNKRSKNNNLAAGLANTLNAVTKAVGNVSLQNKPKSKRRKRRRIATSGPGGQNFAPVAWNKPVSNTANLSMLVKSGMDYIDIVEFQSLTDGQPIFSFEVTPSLCPQLSKFAASFQRIRYRKLMFEVDSRFGTQSAGGYIMGFRPDASDAFPVDPLERKRFISSTPASMANNSWKGCRLLVRQNVLDGRLLYTSPGEDRREYSPGTFFMVCDGSINTAGSYTLRIHWTVECCVESYETTVASGVEEDLPLGGALYGYDKATAWQSGDTATSPNAKWNDVFPTHERPSTFVHFKSEIPYGIGGDAAEDIRYTNIIEYSPEADRFNVLKQDETSGAFKSPTGNTQVLGKGTIFHVYSINPYGDNPSTSLNRRRPRSIASPSTMVSLPGGGKTNCLSYVISRKP